MSTGSPSQRGIDPLLALHADYALPSIAVDGAAGYRHLDDSPEDFDDITNVRIGSSSAERIRDESDVLLTERGRLRQEALFGASGLEELLSDRHTAEEPDDLLQLLARLRHR